MPETSPSPYTYLAAYWKFEMLYAPKTDFVRWYLGQGDVWSLGSCGLSQLRCLF